MRKIFIGIILTSFAFQMHAQQNSEFGISLYPHFSDRRLSYFEELDKDFLDSIELNEMSRLSYEVNLFWQKRSEKVGFYIGLGFLNTGYRTSIDTIEYRPDEYPNANGLRVDLKNINITIPVELNFFQKINDNNEFSFGLGLALSYNVQNYENQLFYSGSEYLGKVIHNTGVENYNRFNTAIQTSVGWKHAFKNGLAFHLEPMFRMWFKPIRPGDRFLRNLYSLGVRTSFTFDRG